MLNWSWEHKVGEVEIFNQDKVITYPLYQGNAFLIMLYEYKENGRDMYTMHNFFADETHAKRMFGLDKKWKDTYGKNYYNQEKYKIKKIRINKGEYGYTKKLVNMLLEAFDDIDIELYSKEASKSNKPLNNDKLKPIKRYG